MMENRERSRNSQGKEKMARPRGGWMDGVRKRRCISMAVSIKHLHFFLSSTLLPSPVDFPVGPEGGIMFGEIAARLHGAAPVQ